MIRVERTMGHQLSRNDKHDHTPGYKHTKEIIFLIRKLMQGSEIYKKELNKRYNVSAAQLNCLLALHEHGSMPLSRIAQHIFVKSSTLTGVVDRLEEKSLVKRMRSAKDRRIINIELTLSGKKLAKKAPPPIQKRILDGLERLPQREINKIIDALRKLSEMLEVKDLEVE